MKHQPDSIMAPLPATRQSGYMVLVSIGLLLIIGVLLLGGYYLWRKHQADMDLLHTYVAKIETELGIKNSAVKEFQSSLAKIAADSESQDVVLGDHLRTLEDHLNTINDRMKNLETSGDDWLLSEVEYMLKMADLRIGMKEDVKGAVRILKNAEELIRKIPTNDKGLINVRVAITRDISSLELYREIDVPGTYADLVTLGETIEKLPMIPTKLTAKLPGTENEKETKATSMLSEINDTFAGYLTIRRHDTRELKALLSPEQRLNFRDSVRLALEQAQTALLKGDQSIYDASLLKVRKWVLDYFVSDNFKVQMAIKKIEELSKVQVKQDFPGVAESQQELKRYITDRMADY